MGPWLCVLADAHAYTCCDGHCNAHAHPNTDANPNGYADTYANPNADAHPDANASVGNTQRIARRSRRSGRHGGLDLASGSRRHQAMDFRDSAVAAGRRAYRPLADLVRSRPFRSAHGNRVGRRRAVHLSGSYPDGRRMVLVQGSDLGYAAPGAYAHGYPNANANAYTHANPNAYSHADAGNRSRAAAKPGNRGLSDRRLLARVPGVVLHYSTGHRQPQPRGAAGGNCHQQPEPELVSAGCE